MGGELRQWDVQRPPPAEVPVVPVELAPAPQPPSAHAPDHPTRPDHALQRGQPLELPVLPAAVEPGGLGAPAVLAAAGLGQGVPISR